MIKHTVFFKLKHPAGSAREVDFLQTTLSLSSIPEVRDLVCVRQTGRKNEFTHGLMMGFDDQAAYDRYNDHPSHVAFVADRWLPEVDDFLEIDYVEHLRPGGA